MPNMCWLLAHVVAIIDSMVAIAEALPKKAKLFLNRVARYLPEDNVRVVESAYHYAARCHAGQTRVSGRPYLEHPLEAALLLVDLKLDGDTIVAALLHDVVEDCGVTLQGIQLAFGAEVARLVDGVTKLTRMDTDKGGRVFPEDRLIDESLRKMLVAMAEDVRVVLIKLADRLHNVQTLSALPLEKRRAIAQETLDIYAPLAHRLGIMEMKWRLEDKAFSHLEPSRYKEISRMLAAGRDEREAYITRISTILIGELEKVNVSAQVTGRPKHIYSIHRKIQKYVADQKDQSQIYDLDALRVLVDSHGDCYNALGMVHSLWHPIQGQFDDYIANPKENLYQSLHTTVMCDGGVPLEVQIKTHEMHQVAEYGVAAHCRYKDGKGVDMRFEDKMTWLRQLLDWQRELRGTEEFLEQVKVDIFPDQVFVYTPKGDIVELPSGSTPIDFAYKIHTDLGHRCVGGKVNGKLMSLDYQLRSGDTLEILASKTAKGPSLDWLNSNLGLIRSAGAQQKVRQWFRKQRLASNVQRGKELLRKELKRLNVPMDSVKIAQTLGYASQEEFLASLGSGSISESQVVSKLTALQTHPAPGEGPQPTEVPINSPTTGVNVMGVGNLLTRMAQCCNPLPGEPIVGFVTRLRGVTVHNSNCNNMRHEDEPERMVHVEWGQSRVLYPVRVSIVAWDRVGLLRDVTARVSEEGVNIASVVTTENFDGTATLSLTLYTKGIGQLSRLYSKLEGIQGVASVIRTAATEAPVGGIT